MSVAHKLFDGTRSNVKSVCARKRVDYDAARPRSSQLPAEPYLNHAHGYRDSVPHCGGHHSVRVIAHNKASGKVCSTHPDNLGGGFTAFAKALCKLDNITPGALCQAGRNTVPNPRSRKTSGRKLHRSNRDVQQEVWAFDGERNLGTPNNKELDGVLGQGEGRRPT